LDTGAEEILLRRSTVVRNGCEMEPMDETTIMFGNGEETTSGTKAFLGNLEAIVCNDNQLTDDFIAIHRIVKNIGGESIPIVRSGRKWLVDLEDLKSVKIKQNSLSCYTVSIANQVMHLHEHMGHPSSESM
jgi:hypothetical protein